jgi:hypothetical protein
MMMAGGDDFSKMAASQARSLSACRTEQFIKDRQESSLAAKSASVSQLSFAEQAKRLAGNIDFLEEIWETDKSVREHIDEKVWSDFMDSVYEHLKYLEDLM